MSLVSRDRLSFTETRILINILNEATQDMQLKQIIWGMLINGTGFHCPFNQPSVNKKNKTSASDTQTL